MLLFIIEEYCKTQCTNINSIFHFNLAPVLFYSVVHITTYAIIWGFENKRKRNNLSVLRLMS